MNEQTECIDNSFFVAFCVEFPSFSRMRVCVCACVRMQRVRSIFVSSSRGHFPVRTWTTHVDDVVLSSRRAMQTEFFHCPSHRTLPPRCARISILCGSLARRMVARAAYFSICIIKNFFFYIMHAEVNRDSLLSISPAVTVRIKR